MLRIFLPLLLLFVSLNSTASENIKTLFCRPEAPTEVLSPITLTYGANPAGSNSSDEFIDFGVIELRESREEVGKIRGFPRFMKFRVGEGQGVESNLIHKDGNVAAEAKFPCGFQNKDSCNFQIHHTGNSSYVDFYLSLSLDGQDRGDGQNNEGTEDYRSDGSAYKCRYVPNDTYFFGMDYRCIYEGGECKLEF